MFTTESMPRDIVEHFPDNGVKAFADLTRLSQPSIHKEMDDTFDKLETFKLPEKGSPGK